MSSEIESLTEEELILKARLKTPERILSHWITSLVVSLGLTATLLHFTGRAGLLALPILWFFLHLLLLDWIERRNAAFEELRRRVGHIPSKERRAVAANSLQLWSRFLPQGKFSYIVASLANGEFQLVRSGPLTRHDLDTPEYTYQVSRGLLNESLVHELRQIAPISPTAPEVLKDGAPFYCLMGGPDGSFLLEGNLSLKGPVEASLRALLGEAEKGEIERRSLSSLS